VKSQCISFKYLWTYFQTDVICEMLFKNHTNKTYLKIISTCVSKGASRAGLNGEQILLSYCYHATSNVGGPRMCVRKLNGPERGGSRKDTTQ
jgi:hypothetical protein